MCGGRVRLLGRGTSRTGLPWASPCIPVGWATVRREVWSATTPRPRRTAPCPLPAPHPDRVLARGSFAEATRIAEILRKETVGGALLLRRHRHRAGLDQLPGRRLLRRAARLHRRPGSAAPGPDPGHLGRRRAAGDLLLRRRAGAQARVRRRRPARPRAAALPILAALGGVVVPAAIYVAGQPRAPATAPCTAGRSRPRPTSRSRSRSWPSSAPTCRPRCGPSCSPWPSSTTWSRSPSSRCSTPTTSTCCLWPAPWCRWRCSRCAVQRRIRSWWLLLPLAAAHLGAGPRVRRPRHRRRRAARLHRPGHPLRGRRRPRRRPGARRALRAPLPADLRRASPCPSSRSSPPASRSAAWTGSTESLTDPIALGIIAGLVLGKPIGILGTAWLTARFTRASLDDEPELARRARRLAARRHRLHRLPAHRRPRLRRRQHRRRPRQGRHPRRLARRRAARRGARQVPGPRLRTHGRRRATSTPTPTASRTCTGPHRIRRHPPPEETARNLARTTSAIEARTGQWAPGPSVTSQQRGGRTTTPQPQLRRAGGPLAQRRGRQPPSPPPFNSAERAKGEGPGGHGRERHSSRPRTRCAELWWEVRKSARGRGGDIRGRRA